jgi:hypothetical protein
VLSKAELKFLLEGKTPNPGYDCVMRHRIRQKLLKFQREDLPALKRSDWAAGIIRKITENRNRITENCNPSLVLNENENRPNLPYSAGNVAPGKGFEPLRPRGPHALKACALPGFATPAPNIPRFKVITTFC